MEIAARIKLGFQLILDLVPLDNAVNVLTQRTPPHLNVI